MEKPEPPPSILFDQAAVPASAAMPAYFGDLNLDQIVDAAIAGREQYELAPFFFARLDSDEAVAFRHEVFRELENETVLSAVVGFGERMNKARKSLAEAEKVHHVIQQQVLFTEAVGHYLEAVDRLASELEGGQLDSRGFRTWREYLKKYRESAGFEGLASGCHGVLEGLSGIQYSLLVKGDRVEVDRFASEPDYGAEVDRDFAKFKQGTTADYGAQFPAGLEMNQVETRILDLVAELHPAEFSALAEFRDGHRDFCDPAIVSFDREIQFYLAWLEYLAPLRRAGLPICLPEMDSEGHGVRASDTYDLALAAKLNSEGEAVVENSFQLEGPERIIVVSGPNQGGKTTFARTFGQLHHLGALGCPVAGRQASLHLFDRLFSIFEREEDLSTNSGKLESDLTAVHEALERAGTDSIIIMNETFTSTTLEDSRRLGKAVLEQISGLDLLAVYVTFVDELASLNPKTVSLVGSVDPDDPARRTFKVVRKPAEGLAYAAAIARKYELTYEDLKVRLAS